MLRHTPVPIAAWTQNKSRTKSLFTVPSERICRPPASSKRSARCARLLWGRVVCTFGSSGRAPRARNNCRQIPVNSSTGARRHGVGVARRAPHIVLAGGDQADSRGHGEQPGSAGALLARSAGCRVAAQPARRTNSRPRRKRRHAVHRDLKPDNVFLVRNDDAEITKVLDFGIAKATVAPGSLGAAASSATRTGAVLGTPYYMSPEQAEGARSLDHRSDIWAMGVIAFECLLGRRPFDEETLGGLLLAICARPIPVPSHFGPVPAGFDAWFARVCSRDLAQRFGSARDAASELKRICDGSAGPHSARFSGPTSAADLSGRVSAVSGPLAGSSSAVPSQSVAGLSATQLDAAGVPKRS